jgi:hypothetical protein
MANEQSKQRASQYARASQRKDRRRPVNHQIPTAPPLTAYEPADELAPVEAQPAAQRALSRQRALQNDYRFLVADLRNIAVVTLIVLAVMILLALIIRPA